MLSPEVAEERLKEFYDENGKKLRQQRGIRIDHETVPGVLFTSRPLAQEAPTIQSLATALIAEFGIQSDFPVDE